MKIIAKYIMSSFIVICTIIFAGCNQTCLQNEKVPTVYSESDNVDINKLNDDQYYHITEKDGLFSYVIYNKDKEVIRSEDRLVRQPTIIMESDSVISVTTQAGIGVATSSTYYYSITNDQFSPIYQAVLAQYKNMVVYATNDMVIIQTIFDINSYYREITSFQKSFAPVAFPFVKAEFVNENSTVRITYLSGMEYQEVSELFALNE